MKQRNMLSIRQLTPPYRYLFLFVVLSLHTTWAHPPARLNFLFIQSVKKCIHNGENTNIFTPTRNLSGFTQTPPRDCKSVFRHFLVNFRSYVSTIKPLHSYEVHSNDLNIYSPLDLMHIFSDFGFNPDDLRHFRMTKMWAIFNDVLKSGVWKNKIISPQHTKSVVNFKTQNDVFSDNGVWDALFKRSLPVTSKGHITSINMGKMMRRKRDVVHDVTGSRFGDVVSSRRSSGREIKSGVPQKRAYGGSWYDLIRNRRQEVLSVNNAMVTLSDMLMEHHRNRAMRNRERLRYYMMLAG